MNTTKTVYATSDLLDARFVHHEVCRLYLDDILDLIAQIAATGAPEAIPVLVMLFDMPGRAGIAAAEAVASFGVIAQDAVRAALDAMDEDTVRNAHRVLAAWGDAYSRRAVNAHCWADLEEEDARLAEENRKEKREENDGESDVA